MGRVEGERVIMSRLGLTGPEPWFLLWALISYGCGGPKAPLDLTTLDPWQDQWSIAAHYSREAASMRQKAEELSNRAALYERLFGPDSEWVTGTRLLSQFYEEVAREHERQAGMHMGLAAGRQPAQAAKPEPR